MRFKFPCSTKAISHVPIIIIVTDDNFEKRDMKANDEQLTNTSAKSGKFFFRIEATHSGAPTLSY